MLGIEPANEPLPRKVFNHHLDKFLETGKLNPEILEHCDQTQQIVINEVKKSLIRLKNKYARQTTKDSKWTQSS